MRDWIKSCKNLVCIGLCAAGLSVAGRATAAGGIDQAADAAAAQALELLNAGKLPDAEAAYTNLIRTYPNSEMVPEATYRLGYVQYMEGNYDQAVATLNGVNSLPAAPEVKAAAVVLIPQVLEAKAGKLGADDPNRKSTFEDASRQFGEFIREYPQSAMVETANYGRAMAAYQIQKYSDAESSLRDNLNRFPLSESLLDSEALLAVVLTAEGTEILKDHGDEDEAGRKFGEALGYLADIIEKHTDVALANDAQFQIGEVLFNRGSAEEGAKREKDLTNAMAAYRAVLPKETMVQAQEERLAELMDRRRQATIIRDQPELQNIQRLQDRENAKLEALKDGPDETMSAQLRIATCYFVLQKYDEARVMLKFLDGFAQDEQEKKQIASYLTLTYAMQGNTGKAIENYNNFESKYRSDPLGENLPLAMGVAFLSPSVNEPNKAIGYFEQEMELYPQSPLVNAALSEEANAMISLARYDDALATYQKFLQTNPPAAQAAAAEEGIATVYRETGKLADSIKQYEKVATDFGGTPEAEESGFYAAGLEATVDAKAALPELQAYVQKYGDGRFTAQAMTMIAGVQAALGDTEAAMKTYGDVIGKYPKSDFAPQAYFQQAAILGRENKTDEMVKRLQEFIDGYPDSKDVFYAYDTIGQTLASEGKVSDAIASYEEMADKHPDNPMAAEALDRVAELWRGQADSLGRYLALNEVQRKDWSKDIDKSIAAAEKLIGQYPESNEVGVVLQTLLEDQQMLLAAQVKTPEQIDEYFRTLRNKYGSQPAAKNRILFTLATFTYQKDPAKGLADMEAAYDASLVYAPADLDLYGAGLIGEGKADRAYDLYTKIAKDYPVPAGVQPAQAQPAIQEAQAIALYGMASALEKQGKTADAGRLYAQLKATYPWSAKVVEADFGIAKSLFQQGKLDEASQLLVSIVQNRNAPADLRAHAFLLIGDIQAAKGNIDAAIDSYLKEAFFYGGVPDAAAEGLWKGGQSLEKQAATLSEQTTPKRSEQIGKAVSAYQEIISKYPNSQFVQQAQGRVSALGSK